MLWNKLNSRRSYSFVGMLMLLIARSCVSPGRALMPEIRVCGEYFVRLNRARCKCIVCLFQHISAHPSSTFDVRCSVRMSRVAVGEPEQGDILQMFLQTFDIFQFFNAISVSRRTFVFQLIKAALGKKITVHPRPRSHSPPHLSPPSPVSFRLHGRDISGLAA